MHKENVKYFLWELSVITLVSVAMWFLFSALVYPILGIDSAAPMPVRTIAVLVIIFIFISRRKETFYDFGLKLAHPLWMVTLLVIAFFITKLLLVVPLGDLVINSLSLPRADTSIFNHIEGNLLAYVGWILAAVAVGGFAEEFIFRGFLMKRLADLFENRTLGVTLALIIQAILFGAMHFYVGAAGVVSGTFAALAFGCFFLLSKRSLIPVMIVHGLWDSLGFTLLFFSGSTSV